MFGEGISRAGEIIDLGAELGIIKKEPDYNALVDRRFVDALRQG